MSIIIRLPLKRLNECDEAFSNFILFIKNNQTIYIVNPYIVRVLRLVVYKSEIILDHTGS